jgi:membrane-associated phospholipid phosphatase
MREGTVSGRSGYRRAALGCAIAYVALALGAALGWLRPLDRELLRVAYVGAPCGLRGASAAASILFAGEATLLYAGIAALALVWYRRPLLAAAVVAGMLGTVPVELASKHLLDQPSPGSFIATVARGPCAPAASGPVAQSARAAQSAQAALPSAAAGEAAYAELSSLPSGYLARASYFGVLLAAALSARWPRARPPLLALLAVVLLLLGSTRVVIAWHWPSDVAAGALLGGGAACTLLALAPRLQRPESVAAPRDGGTIARG